MMSFPWGLTPHGKAFWNKSGSLRYPVMYKGLMAESIHVSKVRSSPRKPSDELQWGQVSKGGGSLHGWIYLSVSAMIGAPHELQ